MYGSVYCIFYTVDKKDSSKDTHESSMAVGIEETTIYTVFNILMKV